MSLPHQTRPVQIWADIDVDIADLVEYLNTIPGVRTQASCQGSIGEGGPAPYRAYVMCTWTPEAFERLKAEFDISFAEETNGAWGYVHPRAQPIRKRSQVETRSKRCHDCPATDLKCKSKNKFCLGFVESLQDKSRHELVLMRNTNTDIIVHWRNLHSGLKWPAHVERAHRLNYLVVGELFRRLNE